MLRSSLLILTALAGVSPALGAVDYVNDIMPIFKAKCFECHSIEAGKDKGNLEFDNLKDMEEFYIGKYTTMRPFNPEESLLLEFVTDPTSDDTMPPEGGDRLTKAEIDLVRQWLAEGAIMDKKKIPATTEPKKPLKDRPVVTWTNHEGKTLQAKLVRLNLETVDLQLENGKPVQYPLDKLSEESLKQARMMARE